MPYRTAPHYSVDTEAELSSRVPDHEDGATAYVVDPESLSYWVLKGEANDALGPSVLATRSGLGRWCKVTSAGTPLAAWTPASAPNLRLWLDSYVPLNVLYQEFTGGGATPSTTTGNPVGTIRDQGGAAHNFVAVADANRPIVDIVEGKGRTVFADGDDFLTGPVITSLNGACTIGFSWRMQVIPGADGAVSLLVLKTSASTWIELVVLNPVSALAGYQRLTFGCDITTSPANAVGAAVALDTGIHRCVLTYNGLGTANPANYTLLFDGAPVTVVASGTFNKTANDLSSVGARWNGAAFSVSSSLVLDALVAWSGVQAPAVIAEIDDWLHTRWKRSYRIIIEGDSIANGYGVLPGQRWRDLLKDHYADNVEVVCVAVDGQNCVEAQAAQAGRMTGLVSSATVKCAVFFNLGTNDLSTVGRQVNGGSPNTLYSNVGAYLDGLEAIATTAGVNLTTIHSGILPRADGNCVGGAAAHEARRAAYHALLASPPANVMMRVDLLSLIGDAGDEFTVYYSDLVHPSALGSVVLAGDTVTTNTAIYAALQALGF
jgi:lysophospholipase L1-like esterase